MGNTSSQVQDESVDGSQPARPPTPAKGNSEDDTAASSQLNAEAQTAVAPSPDKVAKAKKSKKGKKEKRKSRETGGPDAHTDETELSAPQASEGASKEDDSGAPTHAENAEANVASTQAEEPQIKDSRKKRKKDKKAEEDVAAIDAPAAIDGAVEAGAEGGAGGESTSKDAIKKRKRKSEDATPAHTKETVQPAAAVEARPTLVKEDKTTEEQSRKKQKKSTRSTTGTAPGQAKNTPIPLPTFNPPTVIEPEVLPIRKSKRKADAAEAAKKNQVEKGSAQLTSTVSVKEKRTSPADAQAAKDSTKKQKKSKKSRQSDGDGPSAHEETPSQHNASGVELSVIDPALLPPTQQQVLAEGRTTEDASGRKKSKKPKKSQSSNATPADQGVAAVEALLEQQAVPTANGINGNANGTEITGEMAYIEHQKKKQKRKRQTERDSSAQPQPQPQPQPDAAEPKSKKRKKAAEGTAGAKGDAAASGSKGKPQGTEDFPSSGPYTKKEVETLTRAIENYREYNDLSQVQVNDIVQAGVFNEVHGKSCKEFWDEVCPCLPNRWSRETIIKFVRRKWHNFDKRGKWDPEEDQMLKDAYARTPGQWTKIGEAVGRFADDCRDRWRNYLSCSDTMASKRWHDSEVNELLNVVQDCLNSLLERLPEDKKTYWREELQSTESRNIWKPDEIRNLVRKMPDCMEALRAAFDEKHPRESKQKRATEKRRGSSATDGSVVINWDLVSEKMGKKRSRLQIMSKWKALEHTYSQDPKETFFTEANHWRVENGQKWAQQMLPGDKYNIVRAMMDLGLTNEERIIWNSVAHHELVKLKWAHQAKMTFINMKDLVPPQESLPLLLQSLKEHFEANHRSELDNHWRYEGKPGRGSLNSGTSPGPLDWRGHMRGESSYKSNARVTDDDTEDGDDDMKMEQ
ncbi:SANT domain DNA binding protein [Neofusicoccum parvum]|uniref:SANT domain DNA binding protein n=1 Tax=Neofusicoccum parvum TaxID=310453 RepID=A0ACB5RUQ1_9PEZI|nr:SANT domain DNA binding protein [Neofusicoccum parvum]